jgi:uncharacterized protein with HEPN domain
MHKKEEAILRNILEATGKILEFSSEHRNGKDFQEDYLRFDATLMNFIIIGEMVGKLDEKLKDNHPNIPWRKINAFRNILAHDYFGVYEEEVRQIIQNDIPLLKSNLETLLSSQT